MEGDVIIMQDIFRYAQTGVKNGKVEGHFTATGVRPNSSKSADSSNV